MGALIGTGGSVIRRIQWQAHTTIAISNPDQIYPGTQSRIVTVMSPSLAALDAAQQLLLLRLAQNYPERFTEVGVVVPDEVMGRVIGKVRAGLLWCRSFLAGSRLH